MEDSFYDSTVTHFIFNSVSFRAQGVPEEHIPKDTRGRPLVHWRINIVLEPRNTRRGGHQQSVQLDIQKFDRHQVPIWTGIAQVK